MSRVYVLKAERPDSAHLGDVLAGSRPMEMRSAGGKHEDGPGGVSAEPALVERVTQADIEHTRNHRVDPIFVVLVRHHPHASGQPHSNDIWPRPCRITDQHSKTREPREGWEAFPYDILRSDD